MERYWKAHDQKLIKLKQIYRKMSKQLQNKLQTILDSFRFEYSELYNIANIKTKNRINTYIEDWKEKGLLKGQFGLLANNIYKRAKVKNSEILELLIYSIYVEEQSNIEKEEKEIFKEDINYYYKEGQKEVNNENKASIITDALFLYLLNQAGVTGLNFEQWIELTLKYNVDQIYKQVVIDIQQQKEPNIESSIYQNIIQKQENTRLCINSDKVSGGIEQFLIGWNNQAKLEGILKLDSEPIVKFVSVNDDRRTQMCASLDGQYFKVHNWNEFKRYSETNGRMTKYKCYGLVIGLNMPPINDHYHFCRSTFIYVKDIDNINNDDIIYPSYIRMNIDKNYNPSSEIDVINSAILELPKNIQKEIKNSKIEIFTEGQIIKDGKIIKNSFYDRNNDIIHIYQDADKEEVIHEIGHLIETKLNILNDKEYIKVRNSGLENYNAEFVKELEGYDNTIGIKNSKFVSAFQGKIYKNDLNGKSYREFNNNINLNCLGDYFSEGFREYFCNKQNLQNKDKKLFNYIERKINNGKM